MIIKYKRSHTIPKGEHSLCHTLVNELSSDKVCQVWLFGGKRSNKPYKSFSNMYFSLKANTCVQRHVAVTAESLGH